MALAMGNDKVRIYLDGVLYRLNLYSATPIANGILLVTADDYIIKDVNGLFITAKEEDN